MGDSLVPNGLSRAQLRRRRPALGHRHSTRPAKPMCRATLQSSSIAPLPIALGLTTVPLIKTGILSHEHLNPVFGIANYQDDGRPIDFSGPL